MMRLLFWALLILSLVPLLVSLIGMCLWCRQLPWEESLRDQPKRDRVMRGNQPFLEKGRPPYA